MDFKWEMQERIDRGMSEDQAYNATRDSFAAFYDNRDKIRLAGWSPEIHAAELMIDCDCRNVCNCTCDTDCECKNPVNEGPTGLAAQESIRYS